VHVADADNEHGPLKDPVLLVVRENVPVGVIGIPTDVSVTVTVQVDDCAVVIVGGAHATLVELDLGFTVIAAFPKLVLCVESPP